MTDIDIESEEGAQQKADTAQADAESFATSEVDDHNAATDVHGAGEVFDAADYDPEGDTHDRYTDAEAIDAVDIPDSTTITAETGGWMDLSNADGAVVNAVRSTGRLATVALADGREISVSDGNTEEFEPPGVVTPDDSTTEGEVRVVITAAHSHSI